MNRTSASRILPAIFVGILFATLAEGTEFRAVLEEAIRSRGLDPSSLVLPDTMSEEITEWADARIDDTAPPERLLEDLVRVLSSPDDLDLLYDPGFTGTAQEVFDTRRANCLAFTHLFVGLSRHYGLATYYLNFEESERFRRQGDLILVAGHVTAGFGEGRQQKILEFGAVQGFDRRAARRISDLDALALHYSNRSAEMLQQADLERALELSGVAVRLGPEIADTWVNLGVAKRRSGDLDGAEVSYRRAVGVDPDHLPAYHNLTGLLWLKGDRRASREIMKLLDRADNLNPYIYLDLGDLNLESGRLDEAKRFYLKALWLDDSLGEPRAAMGLLALEKGKPDKARTWLRRATKSDPEGARTLELASRLFDREAEADGAC